jgi:hypothetical protein
MDFSICKRGDVFIIIIIKYIILFIYYMSFTRYHDDPVRIEKRLMIGTNEGRYALSTPGQGTNLPFIADPHFRLQRWAGNYLKNAVGIEDDLRGLTRRSGHDDVNTNDYTKHAVYTNKIGYPIETRCLVDESRAILPAFQFREAEMYRWETPMLDPQANIEIPFHYEMQSRIIEKNNWVENLARNNSN